MKIETKNKRKIYIFLTIILGILLSLIAYMLTEKYYIDSLLASDIVPYLYYKRFFLPPSLFVLYIIGGSIFGYVLGVRWWQVVYVERRHWRFKK